MLRLITVCFFYIGLRVGGSDPCDVGNHREFPTVDFGSRNEKCSPVREALCDVYLAAGYYVVSGSTLLNHCPTTGGCGVSYPAWIDGDFPDVEDGLVNRTVCIKRAGDCCKDNVTIMVKNCTSFYVYHLEQLLECSSVYCIESSLPCVTTTTTSPTTSVSKTTTSKKTTDDNDNSKVMLIGIATGVGVSVILASMILAVLYTHGWLQCKRPSSAANVKVTPAMPSAPSYFLQHKQRHVHGWIQSPPPAYEEVKHI